MGESRTTVDSMIKKMKRGNSSPKESSLSESMLISKSSSSEGKLNFDNIKKYLLFGR